MPKLVNPVPCTRSSLDAAEPIVASATAETSRWLCLEYPGRWEAKAWEGAQVSAALRAHVDAALTATPGSRLQLIRQGKALRGRCRVFFASSMPGEEFIFKLELSSLSHLANVDIVAALQGCAPAAAERVDELLLVCTHGKRDQCCALHGLALYKGMSGATPERVWQASHLGGHRFAPTAVLFPGGMMVGRIPSGVAGAVTSAHRARSLRSLETFRGRTAVPAAAQAAEHLVREREGLLGYDDVIPLDWTERPDGAEVRLSIGGRHERVRVIRSSSEPAVHGSCAKPKLSPVVRWALAGALG